MIILNLTKIKNYVADESKDILEDVIKIIQRKIKYYKRLSEAFPNIKPQVQFHKWKWIKSRKIRGN